MELEEEEEEYKRCWKLCSSMPGHRLAVCVYEYKTEHSVHVPVRHIFKGFTLKLRKQGLRVVLMKLSHN